MIPLSGEVGGGLEVYALGALSRARDAINAAARSILEETLGLVIGLLLATGFSGSGGGALSGSELSHLYCGQLSDFCAAQRNLHRYRRPATL